MKVINPDRLIGINFKLLAVKSTILTHFKAPWIQHQEDISIIIDLNVMLVYVLLIVSSG